jgi:hypothetical protein
MVTLAGGATAANHRAKTHTHPRTTARYESNQPGTRDVGSEAPSNTRDVGFTG